MARILYAVFLISFLIIAGEPTNGVKNDCDRYCPEYSRSFSQCSGKVVGNNCNCACTCIIKS